MFGLWSLGSPWGVFGSTFKGWIHRVDVRQPMHDLCHAALPPVDSTTLNPKLGGNDKQQWCVELAYLPHTR